jgi:hypothetical protein
MSEQENPCRAFFDAHAKNPTRVEALWREAHRFEWEKLSASRYSPGPVGDDEDLARVVISPIHIDPESGQITLAFLSDVKNKGGSSDRLTHCSVDEAITRSVAIQANRNATATADRQRVVQGVARFNAKRLRSISTRSGTQAFGVYDTGREDNIGHADVCQLVADEKEARSARWDLLLLVREGFQRA